jgi:hypothetical protein
MTKMVVSQVIEAIKIAFGFTGYSELGCYNEHPVITNGFLREIGHLSSQISPVITNPFYNQQM